MPWTKKDYPNSMKNLPAAVRYKAIEIANALLDEGNMDEGIAIATAISRTKDWAAEHGKSIKSKSGSRSTDVKKHGEDRYVVPHGDEWAIKKEGKKKAERVYRTRGNAIATAKKEAKAGRASVTIQKKTGKVEKRVSYNPNKSAKKSTSKKSKA